MYLFDAISLYQKLLLDQMAFVHVFSLYYVLGTYHVQGMILGPIPFVGE